MSRPRHFVRAALGLTLSGSLLVAAAACGTPIETASPSPTGGMVVGAPTAARSGSPAPSTSSAASASPSASASGAASPSPSGSDALGLPHADPKLEALLPVRAGGIDLETFSLSLDSYIASSTGGDRDLFTAWLVQLGKSASQFDVAVATDLTLNVNVSITAVQVPGTDASKLDSTLSAAATLLKWNVGYRTFGPTRPLVLGDPTADTSQNRGVAYAYARNDVMFFIVTDDDSLPLAILIELSGAGS